MRGEETRVGRTGTEGGRGLELGDEGEGKEMTGMSEERRGGKGRARDEREGWKRGGGVRRDG